jgi:hypothetical protein
MCLIFSAVYSQLCQRDDGREEERKVKSSRRQKEYNPVSRGVKAAANSNPPLTKDFYLRLSNSAERCKGPPRCSVHCVCVCVCVFVCVCVRRKTSDPSSKDSILHN